MKKVFFTLQHDRSAREFMKGLMEPTINAEDADLFFFSGGTDINPAMYGEVRGRKTQIPDVNRDAREKFYFGMAKERGIPMFGVCRGMQFFNVMNGGRLIQHMEGGGHFGHYLFYTEDDGIASTCCHHQAIIPTHDCQVLVRALDGTPEAAWWESTKSLGVQGHPEWFRSPKFVEYATNLLKSYCLGE